MQAISPSWYHAFRARDARFDGVFFIGVTSTSIYCRPICTAKTPKEENCRYFPNAWSAEKAGFRPCLRCRPELAPGFAPVDDSSRIAHAVISRLEEEANDNALGVEDIAEQLEISSRQLRRIVQKELGVSPLELIQTRRLLLAKQLLTETPLAITEVAFASGFASVRRFNDAFSTCYGMPPSSLRKNAANAVPTETSESITLQLGYRPPYAWEALLRFFRFRALQGVEHVEDDRYCRTVRLAQHHGWISITHAPKKQALMVTLSASLLPVLPGILKRVRHLCDINARPDVIASHLGSDPLFTQVISHTPGLRIPGAFDGFELALRTILGQQVSVKAATTLAGRFTNAFGEAIKTPFPQAQLLSPTAEQVAGLAVKDITALGIIERRAASIIAIAEAMSTGRITLYPGMQPDAVLPALLAIPGIGEWTAHYIAMRALGTPDAFPKEDLELRKQLGGLTAAKAEARSLAWRPWRSYATLYLWHLSSL